MTKKNSVKYFLLLSLLVVAGTSLAETLVLDSWTNIPSSGEYEIPAGAQSLHQYSCNPVRIRTQSSSRQNFTRCEDGYGYASTKARAEQIQIDLYEDAQLYLFPSSKSLEYFYPPYDMRAEMQLEEAEREKIREERKEIRKKRKDEIFSSFHRKFPGIQELLEKKAEARTRKSEAISEAMLERAVAAPRSDVERCEESSENISEGLSTYRECQLEHCPGAATGFQTPCFPDCLDAYQVFGDILIAFMERCVTLSPERTCDLPKRFIDVALDQTSRDKVMEAYLKYCPEQSCSGC